MIGQRVRCCCDAAFEEPMVKARSQHLSQNEDVRYLGRLLGDVIRAYGGEELFRRTEYIRRASVDRHCGISGADAVDTGLDRLSLDETLSFVRGFMLFSMLANLAEDRPSRASQPWPSLASALDIPDKQGVARAEATRLLDNGQAGKAS